jgi:hypothetical protein
MPDKTNEATKSDESIRVPREAPIEWIPANTQGACPPCGASLVNNTSSQIVAKVGVAVRTEALRFRAIDRQDPKSRMAGGAQHLRRTPLSGAFCEESARRGEARLELLSV